MVHQWPSPSSFNHQRGGEGPWTSASVLQENNIPVFQISPKGLRKQHEYNSKLHARRTFCAKTIIPTYSAIPGTYNWAQWKQDVSTLGLCAPQFLSAKIVKFGSRNLSLALRSRSDPSYSKICLKDALSCLDARTLASSTPTSVDPKKQRSMSIHNCLKSEWLITY